MMLFLRGKKQRKKGEIFRFKKTNKNSHKEDFNELVTSSTNTRNTVGRKNARTATDLVRFCRSPRD
jgi:hypothetical protein